MYALFFCSLLNLPVAIGLAAKIIVLSPCTPLSFPKIYHPCAVSDAFIPNKSFPTFAFVPLASGVNAVINCSFVAYTVTPGLLTSAAFACTVWSGAAGTSPATIPNTRKPERIFAIPLLILFFLIMCPLLLL